MEWNACKRDSISASLIHIQGDQKFAQEHALGTAQGEHLMAIEY